ncbi:MAG TPA: hypothetical protein VMT30_00945 [Candidatus Saccharimonadia bacterium]|nr:hypothetical protein [Candidatus Saccharimonadia bacterium]
MTVLAWITVLIIGSLAGAIGLVLSLIVTNPEAVGPLGVTVWFVLLLLVLACGLTLGLYGAKTYLRLHATAAARLRYSWRQGMLVSGWLVGMLSLSSLHQLGVLDAILLGILLVIVEVYVRLRWP